MTITPASLRMSKAFESKQELAIYCQLLLIG
jgi:hypothetical protein